MELNGLDEVNRRSRSGWQTFGRLNFIFKHNFPLCLKRKVFDHCVLPALTYGCETWTSNTKIIQKLRVTQRSMERRMLNISLLDHKTNVWVRSQTKVMDIIRRVKTLKWKWAGHVARMKDQKWTSAVLNWTPLEAKRPRRRPKARWADDIRKFAGINWQQRAQDRSWWRHSTEAYALQWAENG